MFLRVKGEIILVNNDSDENIDEYGKRYGNIKIINIFKNEGFGRACNIGAKVARGRTLLFLNPDTEIVSGNVEMVLNEQKNKNIAIIGSNLINSSGKTHKWSAGKKINIYDLVRNNLRLPRSRLIWNSPEKIRADWVSGTALFIRKEVFNKLGGFDEKFFMYFEDIDLCRRAKKHGHRILYFPHFQVFHHSGQSYDNKITQKKHYYASQEYYFKKHCGTFQAILLKILKMFLRKK
jgi:hypothetical protein